MINMFAVMAIDPGGTSGIAHGIFDKDAKTVEEAFKGMFLGQSRSMEGRWREQTVGIGEYWRRFYKDCVFRLGLEPSDVYMVIEDFNLGSHTEVKARAGDDPLISVKIGYGLYAYRLGQLHEWERHALAPAGPVYVHYQMASQAKSFAKNERLKLWNVYRSNKTHENDAWRHVALFLSNRLKQRSSRVRA